MGGIGGFSDSNFHIVREIERETQSVGYSFTKPVRERKVTEVRRQKTSETERMARNSLRRRKRCQTGAELGNT